MIYITGDCHADFTKFDAENFPEQEEMTKDDYVIICGDFGGIWMRHKESEKEKCGKIHRIRSSVIHLMRGQVFTIEGKKIFSFGGARSHDISGGILEYDDPDIHKKRKTLERNFKSYRVNHYSWWEQEMPSEEEMEEGIRNLEIHDNKVDFIVSHCCATSTQALIGGGMYKRDYLNEYLEKIRRRVQFKKWIFGHYHDNRNVNVQEVLIYEQIIRIA